MPIDQYRLSMEARPLRVLYSKYKSAEVGTSLQLVRPLGRIRQERRPSSVIARHRRSASRPDHRDTTVKVERLDIDRVADIKMKQDSKTGLGQESLRNSDPNLNRVDFRENGSPSPTGRSRTQDFQHKFKIAAARKPDQESPPLKSDISYNKKVIHLPLFRVNVKTYSGETEVNKTVARTRESLRKLMEIHRSKMKPANVITANIRNYEFSAPTSITRNIHSATQPTPTMQPFSAKPSLKSRNRDRIVKQTSFIHKRTNAPDSHREYTEIDFKSPEPDREGPVSSRPRRSKTDVETEYENVQGDSLWSVAIRPDTSLTLGSTMNHLDAVVKSPGSDELRELSEVFRGSDSQSAWPSIDETQRMRSRSQSRTFRSKTSLSRPGTVLNDVRPGTVLNDVPETPEGCWSSLRNDDAYASQSPTGSCSPPRPVLRYTSKQPSFKLDPIIVPSHTCTECTMCNLYQKDIETTCPPNSPMSVQCQDPFAILNQDNPHVKSGSGRARAVKPEVMQISRINMNDGMYVTEDSHAFNFMKAKG